MLKDVRKTDSLKEKNKTTTRIYEKQLRLFSVSRGEFCKNFFILQIQIYTYNRTWAHVFLIKEGEGFLMILRFWIPTVRKWQVRPEGIQLFLLKLKKNTLTFVKNLLNFHSGSQAIKSVYFYSTMKGYPLCEILETNTYFFIYLTRTSL